MESVKKYLKDAIAALVTGALAYAGAKFEFIATLHCLILRINSVYCTADIIKWQVFLIVGAIVAIVFARFLRGLVICAIAFFVVPIVIALFNLSGAPTEFFEYRLVVPQQLAVGMILGLVIRYLIDQFGDWLIQWIKKKAEGSTTGPTGPAV